MIGVTKGKNYSGSLFLIAAFLLVAISFVAIESIVGNPWILFLFGVIVAVSAWGISADERIFSINKFFWHFQFIFMGVAPLCQYASGYYCWGVTLAEEDMLVAQALVLLFDAVYFLVYASLRLKRLDKIEMIPEMDKHKEGLFVREIETPSFTSILALIIGAICFAILVKMVGFKNLFFRTSNELDVGDQTVTFLVHKFLTAMPATLCAIVILKDKKEKRILNKIIAAILFVFTICSNFPASTTRYWMGTIFAGLFCMVFLKRSNKRWLDFVILFGLIVAFPLFYSFKRLSVDNIAAIIESIEYEGTAKSMCSVDFDAFSMLARSVRYVRQFGMENGNQLMSVAFFIVPRWIWPSKPYPSGQLIAESINQKFTNLSCPLPGEAYVNFGVSGVVLFAIVIAKLLFWLDDLYWNRSRDKMLNLVNIAYPFLGVIFIYVARGPLQPAIVQTFALLLPLACLYVGLIIGKSLIKRWRDTKNAKKRVH